MTKITRDLMKAFDAGYAKYEEMIRAVEEEAFVEAAERLESPIEIRMMAELWFMDCPYGYGDDDVDAVYLRPEFLASHKPALTDDDIAAVPVYGSVLVQPQATWKEYRFDFLIIARFGPPPAGTIRIVVECDGHDFHERTKEQAAHDRSRDRALTAAGFKVFRFTGSEIFRGAEKCVWEIGRYLSTEADKLR